MLALHSVKKEKKPQNLKEIIKSLVPSLLLDCLILAFTGRKEVLLSSSEGEVQC